MSKKITHLMYDDGSIETYDEERTPIDEAKIVAPKGPVPPQQVQIEIGQVGNYTDACWVPWASPGEYEEWCDNGNIIRWGSQKIELEFNLGTVADKDILFEHEDINEYVDEGQIDFDYYIAIKKIGNSWYNLGGYSTSIENCHEAFLDYDFILNVEAAEGEEAYVRVIFAAHHPDYIPF